MKTNKGITLVALVITIIILLILAGISIATLNGDNGVFTRARQAKNNTLDAQEKENEVLENYLAQIDEILGESSKTKVELKDSNSETKSKYSFNDVQSLSTTAYGNNTIKHQTGMEAGQIVYVSTRSQASAFVMEVGYYRLDSMISIPGSYSYWELIPLGTSYLVEE